MEPILNGIRHLSSGHPVHLEENGELAEINAGLNKAGDYLLIFHAAYAKANTCPGRIGEASRK